MQQVDSETIALALPYLSQLLQIVLELRDQDLVQVAMRHLERPSEPDGLVGMTLSRPAWAGDWSASLGANPVIRLRELVVEAGGLQRSWQIMEVCPASGSLPSPGEDFGTRWYTAGSVRRAYRDIYHEAEGLPSTGPDGPETLISIYDTGELVLRAGGIYRVLTPIA